VTYYDELGLEPTASPEQIRLACRRLSNPHWTRPDVIGQILLDPARRKQYDRSLMALAVAVAKPTVGVRRHRWGRLPVIGAAAALLLLSGMWIRFQAPLALHPSASPPLRLPRMSSPEDLGGFEPLANYAAESGIAIPPLPFPDPDVEPAASPVNRR